MYFSFPTSRTFTCPTNRCQRDGGKELKYSSMVVFVMSIDTDDDDDGRGQLPLQIIAKFMIASVKTSMSEFTPDSSVL